MPLTTSRNQLLVNWIELPLPYTPALCKPPPQSTAPPQTPPSLLPSPLPHPLLSPPFTPFFTSKDSSRSWRRVRARMPWLPRWPRSVPAAASTSPAPCAFQGRRRTRWSAIPTRSPLTDLCTGVCEWVWVWLGAGQLG